MTTSTWLTIEGVLEEMIMKELQNNLQKTKLIAYITFPLCPGDIFILF